MMVTLFCLNTFLQRITESCVLNPAKSKYNTESGTPNAKNACLKSSGSLYPCQPLSPLINILSIFLFFQSKYAASNLCCQNGLMVTLSFSVLHVPSSNPTLLYGIESTLLYNLWLENCSTLILQKIIIAISSKKDGMYK